ncbi:hypothetical protein Dda_3243 [Drechslerella dactyloides]|uniref:Uncharacterized protein n=1 Tax=Drechslerella dactyloides TaxID=74499 RepID=A0AAD6NLK9_DREDA|nr:hypothetical protein Dda_3243 [Drechslerella dactyloides]
MERVDFARQHNSLIPQRPPSIAVLRFGEVVIEILTGQGLSELFPGAAAALPDLERYAAEAEERPEVREWIERAMSTRPQGMLSEDWASEKFPPEETNDFPWGEWDVLEEVTDNILNFVLEGHVPELEKRSENLSRDFHSGMIPCWPLGGETIKTYNAGAMVKVVKRTQKRIVCTYHATLRSPFSPKDNIAQEISRMVSGITRLNRYPLRNGGPDAAERYIELVSVALHGQYMHFSRLQIPTALFSAHKRLPKQPTVPLRFFCSKEFDISTTSGRQLANQYLLAIIYYNGNV